MPYRKQFLSPAQRRTLTLVCDAICPSLAPPPGVEPGSLLGRYWRSAPSGIGAAELVEEALAAATSPEEQRLFRLALHSLENPAACLATTGDVRPFSKRGPRGRERLLRAWSRSSLAQIRQAFNTLKRLAAYTFYAGPRPDGEPNVVHQALNYPHPWTSPARPAPPANPERPLAPFDPGEARVLEADACVIGSGAGGGVVAALLAQAGYRVIVLEAGDALTESDFDGDEDRGWQRMYAKGGLLTTADGAIALLAGRTLGGGTTVNWMTCFRTPQRLVEQWAQASGVRDLLGPGLQAALDAVERRLNVHPDERAVNANNRVLARGAAALGWHHGVQPRNALGCGDCGMCTFGCRPGGKQSGLRTYLQDACDAGARIVVRATAERVMFEGTRAVGVEARINAPGRHSALPWRAQEPGSRLVHVRAPLVVVAAGAIESPALLLRSGLKHPALGRNLYLHPATAVLGTFQEEINAWSGPPQSVHSNQFTDLDGEGYGFTLEATPVYPGIAATALPWLGGADFKSRMSDAKHTASVLVLCRDRWAGRVTIDRWGNPVPRYSVSRGDEHHILRGCKEGARLLMAAGALEAHTLHSEPAAMARAQKESRDAWRRFDWQVERRGVRPHAITLFSAHQMGTCRMGVEPRTSVVDGTGAVHGYSGLYVADGSIFPLASGVNPMISIMGLAHWVGSRLASRS